ncbi:MAG TPA: glycoside hydrolase family 3 N-terminal domain-containing protein, partial [Capsulimonadaceae bacterium]|nr:glycoside hydrolase family 3 N-terminal domain-containing protein [Capsulimonadaceae bacterium]
MRFQAMAALALLLAAPALAQTAPTYKDPSAPLESRVNDLFSQLTQDEKLSLLSGTGFTTQPIPRLGVPAMAMADAGQGVRGGPDGTLGPATLFPAEVDMAQSWDLDLLHRIGEAIGVEARNKGGVGVQILLGPDINIHRSPLGGRDSESFTEDPYLNGQLAAAYIQGLQSSGDAACVKHFAANNEEIDRNTVNVDVSQRALREIYLPGFETAVKNGNAYAVMAAYNKVNGPYCTANHPLETDILKGDWSFTGIVMSDWGAVHETAAPVAAGCDLEMPGGSDMTSDKLKTALAAGQITQPEIDESVRRILRTIIRVGLLDGPLHPDADQVNSPEHQKLALEAATKAVVLLKNQGGVLPLDSAKIRSIAVIGPGAVHLQAGAQGSPAVTPFYQVTPLDGIKKRVGAGITVNYVQGVQLPNARPDAIPSSALAPPTYWNQTGHGLVGSYYTSPDLSGKPAQSRLDSQVSFFRFGGAQTTAPDQSYGSAQWDGTLTPPDTGTYMISLATRAGCRLVIDGKALIDSPKPSDQFGHNANIDLAAGKTYTIHIEVLGNDGPIRARLGWILPAHNDIAGAVAAAKSSDIALVFVSTAGTDGEGRDRPSMDLPGDQDKLIQAVAAANKNTIVVLNVGSPVTVTKWLRNIPVLVDMG